MAAGLWTEVQKQRVWGSWPCTAQAHDLKGEARLPEAPSDMVVSLVPSLVVRVLGRRQETAPGVQEAGREIVGQVGVGE